MFPRFFWQSLDRRWHWAGPQRGGWGGTSGGGRYEKVPGSGNMVGKAPNKSAQAFAGNGTDWCGWGMGMIREQSEIDWVGVIGLG